jgi:hypothetical protein
MGLLRLGLGLFPTRYWHWLLRLGRVGRGAERTWIAAELTRGSSVDLAEAGRALSRYDGRAWLRTLASLPDRRGRHAARRPGAAAQAAGAREAARRCGVSRSRATTWRPATSRSASFPALLAALASVAGARSREQLAATG